MRLIIDISTLESSKAVDDMLIQLRSETQAIIYDAISRYEKLLEDDTGDKYRVSDGDSIVDGIVNTLTCAIRGFVNTPTEWNIDATTSTEIVNSLIETIVCNGERINEISEEVFIAVGDITAACEDIVDAVPIGDLLDTQAINSIETAYKRYAKRVVNVCRTEIEMLVSILMATVSKQ